MKETASIKPSSNYTVWSSTEPIRYHTVTLKGSCLSEFDESMANDVESKVKRWETNYSQTELLVLLRACFHPN
jgi:hypothetical protein